MGAPRRAPTTQEVAEMTRYSGVLRLLALLGLLYMFFLGLDLMGLSFKLFGKGFAEELVARTSNPFVGLFVGILATTLVQSSSTTTSMTVGLVAAGGLTVEGAIPIIMGANIGTSVTNTLVSLAHVTRREEFRRAFAGATVHDFFNWMTVLVVMPMELGFGYLSRFAGMMEKVLEGSAGIKMLDPLKAIVRPVAKGISELLGDSGTLTLIVGVLLLFAALRYLVKLLKALLSAKAEQLLHRTLFRSAFAAILAGMAMTVMVQSSSITTSVVIPLVGAGVLTLEQIFPFTIGANIGTTITAMLAALATGNPAAVTVAFSHLLFNLTGTAVIYPLKPLRAIPLAMARWMGDLAARNRVLAAAYIAAAFYGLPLLLLFLTGALDSAPSAPAVEAPAVHSAIIMEGANHV
jgi:sodium-dependent phosphate cotransporter